MKKPILILLAALLVVVGISGSCVYQPSVVPEPEQIPESTLPEEANSDVPAAVLPPGEETVITGDLPLGDISWISPGKVEISNFYPGARAEWNLKIYNAKDTLATFDVKYRFPDRVAEGYIKAPPVVQDWVIIADPTPVLAPKEVRDVLIVVAMPADAESPAPKWEFWISVRDTTQTGFVQTELCSRWLVCMR